MKAVEWIDLVKKSTGLDSDYAVAGMLGMSRSTVSKYRNDRTPTLDEESAIKVAIAIGERPEAVILDQAAERVKSPEARAALLDAARRLCILCLIPDAMKILASYARATGLNTDKCRNYPAFQAV